MGFAKDQGRSALSVARTSGTPTLPLGRGRSKPDHPALRCDLSANEGRTPGRRARGRRPRPHTQLPSSSPSPLSRGISSVPVSARLGSVHSRTSTHRRQSCGGPHATLLPISLFPPVATRRPLPQIRTSTGGARGRPSSKPSEPRSSCTHTLSYSRHTHTDSPPTVFLRPSLSFPSFTHESSPLLSGPFSPVVSLLSSLTVPHTHCRTYTGFSTGKGPREGPWSVSRTPVSDPVR